MRIGIDTRLPYYRMGGISRYVLQLLRALANLTSEHTFMVLQKREDAYNRAPKGFTRGRLWTPCHHRWEKWLLAAELLPHRLDVLHSPDFIPPVAGAARRVITVHDLSFLYFPEHLTAESRRYYNEQIGWAVQEADAIAADSEHTRQDLVTRLGVAPDKVKAIHLAADPIFSEPVRKRELDLTMAHFGLRPGYVLFVGTLEPRKNIPTLLHAYGQLRQADITIPPLVLAGSKGWLYDEIFATVDALGLNSSVIHLEGVTDRQLAHLYHGAILLALPSWYEGFGLPALEAMSSGCPVIASDRASLPEVVGQAGVLLDANDVGAWADALATLLRDEGQRQALAAKGRKQAATFSWRKTAEATLRLYVGGE